MSLKPERELLRERIICWSGGVPRAKGRGDLHVKRNNEMASTSASTSLKASTNAAAAATPTVQEFSITIPKNAKKMNIMRFNDNLNIKFSDWTDVKMERENNKVDKRPGEELPKYGAGSEFRREEKEEARRKKYGFNPRRYKPDDQPWILQNGSGKDGKKFKGIREGGVSDNAAFYIFTHGNNGIEAYPASEWYHFQPAARFKPLTAEEADLEFKKRTKTMNLFALKYMKRNENGEEEDEGGSSRKRLSKGSLQDFKISEMDDWVNTDDDDDSSNAGDSDDESGKKKKKKTSKKSAPKKKANSDESAIEESDDGDEEGREREYISDSSEDMSDTEGQIKGVDEEKGLRNLLSSEDEEEEEKKDEDKNKGTDKPGNSEEKTQNNETLSTPSGSKRKRKRDSPTKPESSTESDDSLGGGDNEKINSLGFMDSVGSSEPPARRIRMDTTSTGQPYISEEVVRRYLTRKPMTIPQLCKKFRKLNFSSKIQLEHAMGEVLKKLNLTRHIIQGKMHISMKPDGK